MQGDGLDSRKLFIRAFVLWAALLETSGKRFVERHTIYGTVRGFVDTLPGGHKVEKFLGVPYARPPVGDLRFEPPAAPEKWHGSRSALELAPACSQTRSGVEYIQLHVPDFNKTSEDCLYLNIFVPKNARHYQRHVTEESSRRRHAVLVFVHGGSYMYGMGAMLDGSHLATYDVVVVTFNYRLGPLGFLETHDDSFPGNYGLLDQVAALRWVHSNIHYFGGDPSRVTIDGHSAGGCSVGLLMLIPAAKGLFSRVIQQSGSPFADWAVTRQPRTPNFYFKLFTAAIGCYGNGTAEVKACLKLVATEKIQGVIQDQPVHPVSMVPRFRPVVDGKIVPDSPEKMALYGDINVQEVLVGTTTDEGLEVADLLFDTIGEEHHGLQRLLAVMSSFSVDLPEIKSLLETVMEQYYRWPYNLEDNEIKKGFAEIVGDYFITAPTQLSAELLAARNKTVFLYNFDYFSIYDPWKGSKHGAELFYLSGFPLSGHANFRYDETDRAMSAKLMQMWANFVQNGLPSLVPQEDFHMSPYTATEQLYTQITANDDHVSMVTDTSMKAEKMAFWNDYVPTLYLKQIHHDLQAMDSSVRHISRWSSGQTLLCNASNSQREAGIKQAPAQVHTQRSSKWILIAACVGLSLLTLLLSIFYCQVKTQVKMLLRQVKKLSSSEAKQSYSSGEV